MSGSQRAEVIAQLSQRLQSSLGVPEGLRVASPFPFGGMDQQSSPIAMKDQDFFWCENLIRLGDGNLRALPDVGSTLYIAPAKTILCAFGYNIAATYYHIVFFTDGTAVQVNEDTQAVTTISSTAGTFYNGGNKPTVCPSGGKYLLIANNHAANAYWVWDGLVLYNAGSVGPDVTLTSGGANYTSAPLVTAFGGSGTGATFTASIANGSVVSVQVDNVGSGYLPGDTVQLQFTGGGSDNGAILTAVLTASIVSSMTVLSGGSGYTDVPTVTVSSGAAAATANLTPTGIGAITVTNGGSGYTAAPTVTLSGGGGTGATATATISGGAITAITVTSPGSGYTSRPTVGFLGGGGSSATATAALAGTTVASLTVTNAGSGYTASPTIGFSGGGGGTGATAAAVLSAGAVTSVTVVNGGSGFTETPTIAFTGGGGTGATAVAVLSGGSISSVTISAGGSGYTSAPTVSVGAGGNNAASGSVDLMPFGVSGIGMENYLSRVWLLNTFQPGATSTAGVLQFSTAGSVTDFSTSSGGGTYTSTDRYLRSAYWGIKQANGYLYLMGDSSVSVISNVQTSGSASVTTFTYQNTDPQIGTNFPNTLSDYGRTVLFGNALGIFGLYGGAVTGVSDKVRNIFDNAIFPPTTGAITPSGAAATIHKVKFYTFLFTITDPFTGQPRTAMLLWDQKEWYVASQSVTPTFIWSQERNSVLTTWATDGAKV